MYQYLFICSPIKGHLVCFQFLVIKNKDVINICMQGFVYKYNFLILLDKHVKAQLLNLVIQLCLAL